MNAKELLEAGRLGATIDQLNQELRNAPTDQSRRIFLFETLCYAGDLNRAEKQLDILEHQDERPPAHLGLKIYRQFLKAERDRQNVFQKGARPHFVLEAPPSAERILEALAALRNNHPEKAAALVKEAESQRKPTPCRVGDLRVDDIRDADDILAPVLEVFAPSGYCWIPWEHVQFLEIIPPKTLRDLLWIPAKVATFDAQMGEVWLPNLYPDSPTSTDEEIRLGRKTDWLEPVPGITRGVGMKLFLVGEDALSLPEIGNLQFDAPAKD